MVKRKKRLSKADRAHLAFVRKQDKIRKDRLAREAEETRLRLEAAKKKARFDKTPLGSEMLKSKSLESRLSSAEFSLKGTLLTLEEKTRRVADLTASNTSLHSQLDDAKARTTAMKLELANTRQQLGSVGLAVQGFGTVLATIQHVTTHLGSALLKSGEVRG